MLPSSVDDRLLVGGKTGAFEEEGADLALELAHGPVALEAFVFVEGTLERVVEADEFLKFRPRELKDQASRMTLISPGSMVVTKRLSSA